MFRNGAMRYMRVIIHTGVILDVLRLACDGRRLVVPILNIGSRLFGAAPLNHRYATFRIYGIEVYRTRQLTNRIDITSSLPTFLHARHNCRHHYGDAESLGDNSDGLGSPRLQNRLNF